MSLAWTFDRPQWCEHATRGDGCTHTACHRALALAEQAHENPDRYCTRCGEELPLAARECPACESRHDRHLDEGWTVLDADWWREMFPDTDEEPAF